MTYRLEDLSLERMPLLEEILGLGGLGAVVYGPDRRVRWAFGPVPLSGATSPSDLVGRTCQEVHAGSDAPCDPCLLERSSAAGPQRRVIHVGSGAVGSTRLFEISIGPVASVQGEEGGWIELVREIREADGLVGLIHASATDILRMLRTWSIPVVILDGKDRVLSWNLGASRLYGRREDEVIGRPWSEVVGESGAVELLHIPGTLTRRYQAEHRTSGGAVRNVMVTRTELTGTTGEREGAFALVLDVTESKALEQRLERRVGELSVLREIAECLQSEMELHRILRTILVGATAGQGLRFNRAFLLLVDDRRHELRGRDAVGPSDADEAHRVWSELDARERGLREMLRDIETLMGKPGGRVREIVENLRCPLDDRASFLVRALHSPTTVRVVDGVERPSGTEVEATLLDLLGVRSLVAVPLVAEGRPVGLLLADNAITARAIPEEEVAVLELLGIQAALAIARARVHGELARQLTSLEQVTSELRANEERLVRAERLSAVGEMAARVVHEVRNPLAAIGGFARALLRGTESDAARQEALEIIVSEVRRLETILRDVLDFSRPVLPRIAPLDVERVAAEALDLLRWEMDEAGVRGAIERHGELPEASADRDQIFQAIVNVVRNAIHAMARGGSVTIGLRALAHAVEVAVRDEGSGIPVDVRTRVFEPFFTTKSSGSGLGLTIASQIIRDHGGEIRIESREGEGTTVYLRIPRAKESASHGQDPDRRG